MEWFVCLSHTGDQNFVASSVRKAIGSYFGEKVLLATPHLRWYLEHGLEVTHICQTVDYSPIPCLKPFGPADAREMSTQTKTSSQIQ